MTPTALLFANLALSGLVADLSGAFTVSDTTQATIAPSPARAGQQLDIENVPLAQIGFAWPDSTLAFGYGPRFLLRDALEESDPTLLHLVQGAYGFSHRNLTITVTATYAFGRDALDAPALILPTATAPPTRPPATDELAGAEPIAPTGPSPFRVQQTTSALTADIGYTIGEKRLKLTLRQQGELRDTTLSGAVLAVPSLDASAAELGAGTSPVDLVSRLHVRNGSETTSADLSYAWTRRVSSNWFVSYALQGGLGERSKALLPLQRIATGRFGVTDRLSRRDELLSELGLVQTEVANGNDSWVFTLGETWRRQWSADVNSSLGAGLAVSNTGTEASAERETKVEPIANASVDAILLRGAEASWSMHAGASLVPFVNATTGRLQTRVNGDVGTALRVDHTELSAEADAAQTLPADEAGSARVIGAGAGISQDIAGFVFASARYRSVWQNVGGLTGMSSSVDREWSAIFALTLVAPAVTF